MLYAEMNPGRTTHRHATMPGACHLTLEPGAAKPRTFDPPEWVYMALLAVVLTLPLGLPASVGHGIPAACQLVLLALLVLVRDRRQRAHAAQQAVDEARCRAIVQGSSDVIAVLNPAAEIQYVSPSTERVLGVPAADRLGRSALERVHPDDLVRTRQTLGDLLANPEAPHRIELRLQHADGSWRWMALAGVNRLLDPALRGIVLAFRDVTEKKNLEETLRFRAFHDPLTGLANRALLEDRLERALAGRRQPASPAVLLLDLDGFKAVNDRMGHPAGDALLIAIGRRIQSCLRAGDTVGRLGGDEFAIVALGLSTAQARGLAGRIVAAVALPLALAEGRVAVGASLGIAVASRHACTAAILLSQADAAMYAAKLAGGGHRLYYGPRPTPMGVRRAAHPPHHATSRTAA